MDLNMVKYLAELSKLEYSDKELAATAEQMTDIIDLMDTVRKSTLPMTISRTIMMFTSTI